MELDDKLSPCPLSPHYRIPTHQAWQSLLVYFVYRLALGSVLGFLFFMGILPSALGRHDPNFYVITIGLYFGSIFLAAPPLIFRRPPFAFQAQLQVFADLITLPCIMYASGGVESGVGALLAISVAAGGVLTGGRCALLFAAAASLAVLASELFGTYTQSFERTHWTYTGMLGGAYFGIALLAVVLARRAEQSEAFAVQQGHQVANLEQLNAFIIHHLQSGILVIDDQQSVRMLNGAAARLLDIPEHPQPLAEASPALKKLFQDWLAEPEQHTRPLPGAGGESLQVRFTRLGQAGSRLYMVFLEDNVRYNERVQLSKLASLGRLTASIAHEIRNPLSAIKHASQLLAEAPNLADQDRRLTQIVQDHVTRVNDVIENVLQLSRRRESQRETTPLSDTVERLLAEYETGYGAPPKSFELVAGGETIRVAIDISHLRQILDNLLSNALRYGQPEAGPIRIHLGRHHGEPFLEIHDNGHSIEPGIVQQMFEPFFTTSPSGTGLGLYIARELAELNQARLEYLIHGNLGFFRLTMADPDRVVVAL